MKSKKKAASISHLDESGRLRMVDPSTKPETLREAVAEASLVMFATTAATLREGTLKKGDAITAARLAGIQAAKRTDEMIPLCHAIALSQVEIETLWPDTNEGATVTLTLRARCSAIARTGVEMEALLAVSVAALTLYDFCKAVEKSIRVDNIHLVSKSGGKSGIYKHLR